MHRDSPVPNCTMTRHIQRRMQQRGRTQADFDLIYGYGTEVRPDLYVLRDRDADELIHQNKQLAHIADRLRGWAVVVCEGSGVTCYFLDGAAGRYATRGFGARRQRSVGGHRHRA